MHRTRALIFPTPADYASGLAWQALQRRCLMLQRLRRKTMLAEKLRHYWRPDFHALGKQGVAVACERWQQMVVGTAAGLDEGVMPSLAIVRAKEFVVLGVDP